MKKALIAGLLTITMVSCHKNRNLPVFTCDEAAILNSDFSNQSNYTIKSVELSGDCLSVTVSHNGCTTMKPTDRFDLYMIADYTAGTARLKLIGPEIEPACALGATSNISFNLFALKGGLAKGTFILSLQQWDKPITYKFGY